MSDVICINCGEDICDCTIDCDRKAVEMAEKSKNDELLSAEETMEFLLDE